LGIVGVVFSPMPIINNLSALIAVVGIILALIALFGSRKVLAGIGAGLCVLAIVFTVAAQTALTKGLSGQGGTVGRVGGSGQQASNDAAQHIPFGQSAARVSELLRTETLLLQRLLDTCVHPPNFRGELTIYSSHE
jgi:hypothetical protein